MKKENRKFKSFNLEKKSNRLKIKSKAKKNLSCIFQGPMMRSGDNLSISKLSRISANLHGLPNPGKVLTLNLSNLKGKIKN